MKNIDEIRRDRLEDLVNETKSKSLEEVAEIAGTSAAYLSQIRNQLPDSKTGIPKKMGSGVAEKLRIGFKKPKGWMDTIHPSESRESNSPPIPQSILSELEWKNLNPKTRAFIESVIHSEAENKVTEEDINLLSSTFERLKSK